MDIKDYAVRLRNSRLSSGHKSCVGCGFPAIMRMVSAGTDKKLVAGLGTGCVSVTSTTAPHYSWTIPTIHNAFANLAATVSGIETAYRILKRKGRIKDDVRFVAFGGDGGSFDIGLQSLSGALERNHKMVYVCYNNEAYMNTGDQKSSATPYGTDTSTTPEGKLHHGKELFRKDLTRIAAAHDIPYVAQGCTYNFADLIMKAQKAFEVDGPAFINVLSPCVLFWRIPTGFGPKLLKLAMDTCYWPLYEVENKVHKLNYKPAKKLPVTEFLKLQGRFKHLFKPENKRIIDKLQKHVDEKWNALLRQCK